MKKYLTIYLKGVAMGGADVLPGVSGGTIAFITGIYNTLISSLAGIDLKAIKLLFSGKLKSFWEAVNGTFLLPLLLGIATSLLSLAKLMVYLLDIYPVQVWSFFFGLILASAPMILKDVSRWKPVVAAMLVAGIALGYGITTLSPLETPEQNYFIFISGMLAICAMVLPGISGAFILLLLGKYTFILEALGTGNINVILIFGAGCAVGLLSFIRILNYVIKRFPDLVLGTLSGFMLGSLNKVWPWKTTQAAGDDGTHAAAVSRNLWPQDYTEITTQPNFLIQALIFCTLGIAAVIILEKTARQSSEN